MRTIKSGYTSLDDYVHMNLGQGDTPLHIAIKGRHLDTAKLFIENGAQVNRQNNNGHTPLHIAAQEGYIEGITLLIENGADVNMKNFYGDTPLHIALRLYCANICPDINIVKFLLDNKADLMARDNMGYLPSYYARNNPQLRVMLNNKALVQTMWSIWHENIQADRSYSQWPPHEAILDVLKLVEESELLPNTPQLS